jgi:hypothetical protein
VRESDEKLAGWDLSRDHFVIEEILEVKYPQSYQATFGGTPRTAHMIGEGVVFVYFNHASKNFERFKISLAPAPMVIPTEKRLPVPPQRPDPTPPQISPQQPRCLCKLLHNSNQCLGCPYRQLHFNSQRQCRLS